MKRTLRKYLVAAAAVLLAVPTVQAQSADLTRDRGDVVRVTRQPDGTRSVYQRQVGWHGMRCSTYSPSGKLVAVNVYTEGKYGHLVSCIIYDHTKKNILYKVQYGYDARARLIEERMYAEPSKKLVQRVIYRYDSSGNRSKPLIISLNTGGTGPVNEITPTMRDDVNKINREARGQAAPGTRQQTR